MNNDDKKSYKVRIAPEALSEVPDTERATVLAEIEKAFTGISVGDPLPGEPVLPIPSGTRICPQCHGPLEEGPLLEMAEGSQLVLDCERCNRAFIEAVE